MGYYGNRIVPKLIDVSCGAKSLRPLRDRVCAGLTGEVVEVGFGSGHNVPHYPPMVTRVAAVEPSARAWELAAARLAASNVPIQRSGVDGQSLPFPDESFDSALSTWTLCTIPDPVGALRELRRVLRPGGSVHFLEHGLAPDPKVQRWQHRLDPIQARFAGGCTFSRPIAELVTRAGFTIATLEAFYAKGEPRFAGALSLGVGAR